MQKNERKYAAARRVFRLRLVEPILSKNFYLCFVSREKLKKNFAIDMQRSQTRILQKSNVACRRVPYCSIGIAKQNRRVRRDSIVGKTYDFSNA